jgi:hypothetical protein
MTNHRRYFKTVRKLAARRKVRRARIAFKLAFVTCYAVEA